MWPDFRHLTDFLLFFGLLASAFLAYTKFVIERGIFPPAQFSIDCNVLGSQKERFILEILLHVKNLGSSVLVVNNLCLELRYLEKRDEPGFISLRDPNKMHLLGRLNFPHCLKEDLCATGVLDAKNCNADKEACDHSFCVLRHRTFVKPGVDQVYTFGTSVPDSVSYVRIYATFEYPKEYSRLQRYSLAISRRLGLINYALKNIVVPHTCERIFKVELAPNSSN
jgi:hypothetical protein